MLLNPEAWLLILKNSSTNPIISFLQYDTDIQAPSVVQDLWKTDSNFLTVLGLKMASYMTYQRHNRSLLEDKVFRGHFVTVNITQGQGIKWLKQQNLIK